MQIGQKLDINIVSDRDTSNNYMNHLYKFSSINVIHFNHKYQYWCLERNICHIFIIISVNKLGLQVSIYLFSLKQTFSKINCIPQVTKRQKFKRESL